MSVCLILRVVYLILVFLCLLSSLLCIVSPRSSPLSLIWNGQRLPSFASFRGLRQGDPLSPYLFVICMEKLSLAISEAVQTSKWHPIKVAKDGPYFSHFFSADDVFLFSKATCSQTRFIVDLFARFSVFSRLRINVAKSRSFFSKGVSCRKIEKIYSISSIRNITSLGKYLGFPLFKGKVKKEDFGFIIDEVCRLN